MSTPAAPSPAPSTPDWLTTALQALRARFPDDRYEIVRKSTPANAPEEAPEWRIKCVDCPGKLYNVGPGETLDNFTVHARNRYHRSTVDGRVNGTANEAPSVPPLRW